jgi:hypothetical protein
MKRVAVFGNAGGPKYRQLVAEAAKAKRVHHLWSPRQIRAFLDAIKQEYRGD